MNASDIQINPEFVDRVADGVAARMDPAPTERIRVTALGMAIQWCEATKQSMAASAIVKAAGEFEEFINREIQPERNDNG